jgi:hypothetical protein
MQVAEKLDWKGLIFYLSNKRVNHNITHISFMHEYAVQFVEGSSIVEAYKRKNSYEKTEKI